jgi:hypothetical protein
MAAALALNSSEEVEIEDVILGIPCHPGPCARDPAICHRPSKLIGGSRRRAPG